MKRAAGEVDVRISAEAKPGSDVMLLRFERMDSGAKKDFLICGGASRLDAIRTDLPNLMTPLRLAIGRSQRVALAPKQATAALDRLNALAWGVLSRLLENATIGAPARRVGAQTFVREVSQLLFAPPLPPGKPWQRPLVVEVSARDDLPLAWHLPIELIPLDLPGRGAAASGDVDALFGFLGMAAIVIRRRRAGEADPPAARRRKTPLAVVSTGGPNLLYGVSQQRKFFEEKKARFAFDDKTIWPWDLAVRVDAAQKELASIVLATQVAAAKSAARPVLHFCCHYGRYRNVQSIGITPAVRIGVTALDGELARPPNPEFPPEEAHRPFVFLNACESSAGLRGDESLLKLLFKRGFCHVIGGETLLPERVAGAFACHFYDFVLSGDPVGIALWRTRHHFRQTYRSPAGLFYTFYGSPEIRVG